MGNEPRAVGIATLAGAAALGLSAFAGSRLGLIFHFHPIVVGAALPWLLRRLAGHRPSLRALATLGTGFALSLAAYQLMLDPLGDADAAPLTAAFALAGWLFGIWVALRSKPQRAEAQS